MLKLLLIYCSFVIACLVVVVAFMTATTYTQLVVAILLYPMFVYFALKVFPIKQRHAEPTSQAVTFSLAKPEQEAGDKKINNKTENISISDIDKRAFLKLIGGTGLAFFLYSIFNKKAEGLFPGMAPAAPGLTLLKDTAGNKIDPAQKKPLDDYSISDIENGTISFYGFISKDGAWYIMRLDTNTGAFRYTKDKSNFRANWTNRANLKYDFFDSIFKP